MQAVAGRSGSMSPVGKEASKQRPKDRNLCSLLWHLMSWNVLVQRPALGWLRHPPGQARSSSEDAIGITGFRKVPDLSGFALLVSVNMLLSDFADKCVHLPASKSNSCSPCALPQLFCAGPQAGHTYRI
jgi:hypothetical protein